MFTYFSERTRRLRELAKAEELAKPPTELKDLKPNQHPLQTKPLLHHTKHQHRKDSLDTQDPLLHKPPLVLSSPHTRIRTKAKTHTPLYRNIHPLQGEGAREQGLSQNVCGQADVDADVIGEGDVSNDTALSPPLPSKSDNTPYNPAFAQTLREKFSNSSFFTPRKLSKKRERFTAPHSQGRLKKIIKQRFCVCFQFFKVFLGKFMFLHLNGRKQG